MIIVIFKLKVVEIFLDIVRNVYILRKKESVIFLMNMDFIKILSNFCILFFYLFWFLCFDILDYEINDKKCIWC